MATVLKVPINVQLTISILVIIALVILVYFLNRANQLNIDFFNKKEDNKELEEKLPP